MKDHPDQLDLESFCNKAEAETRITDPERRAYVRGWEDRKAGRTNAKALDLVAELGDYYLLYCEGYLDARWLDTPDPAAAYCRINSMRVAV